MSETEIGSNNKKESCWSTYDYVAEEIGYHRDENLSKHSNMDAENPERVLKDPTIGVHKAEHYNVGKYECREVMKEIFTEPLSVEEGFYLGNAFKYLWRCQQKGCYLKDIAKVKEYCEFILNMHKV